MEKCLLFIIVCTSLVQTVYSIPNNCTKHHTCTSCLGDSYGNCAWCGADRVCTDILRGYVCVDGSITHKQDCACSQVRDKCDCVETSDFCVWCERTIGCISRGQKDYCPGYLDSITANCAAPEDTQSAAVFWLPVVVISGLVAFLMAFAVCKIKVEVKQAPLHLDMSTTPNEKLPILESSKPKKFFSFAKKDPSPTKDYRPHLTTVAVQPPSNDIYGSYKGPFQPVTHQQYNNTVVLEQSPYGSYRKLPTYHQVYPSAPVPPTNMYNAEMYYGERKNGT